MRDSAVFVDTNILVYAHDERAGERHRIAKERIAHLWRLPLLANISVQVLQELYVHLRKRGVPAATARETVTDYLHWNVVSTDRSLLEEGLRLAERWQVFLWDALILAAARRAGADVVWSEDLNAGQQYEGVLVVNPFAR